MNAFHEQLAQISLAEILPKIEAPGSATSRRARPLLEAHLRSMGAVEQDLGQLAPLFLRWLDISGTMDPKPPRKAVVICCADHGVAAEGVSAYPQETTLEMVRNYTVRQGGAANAFAAYAGAHLLIDDMGIAADTGDLPGLFLTRIASGTRNMAKGPAMTREQAADSIKVGLLTAKSLAEQGFDWFLPGEMGIANTTASAAIAAVCCGESPEEVTGRGTNISDARLQKKVEVVRRALQVNRPDPDDAIDILAKVGGFEFGCMAGLILGAALHRKLVILDGANCGAAALLAQKLAPASIAYTMASHFGSEKSHRFMLESLGLQPILHLDLRLGEAIGSSIAGNILEGMIASWQALRREEAGDESPAIDHCEMREEEVKLTDKTFDFYLTTMPTPDREAMEACKLRIDNLTKPVDSLGCLEQIAAELAGCSGNERPDIETSRMAMICFTAQDSVPPAMEETMAAQADLIGARLAIAQLSPGKRAAAAFDFGREEGERYAVMNEVIALSATDGEGEPCGAMNRALRQALLTESGALRFKGDDFLGHVPPRYQGIVSSLLGAMIAAAHNGAMIVLDSEAVQIVARYAAKIVPELRSFLLPVEPPLTGIGAQLPGLTAACGLQIVRASLFMLNEMKTFDEANVSTASDGPGAKRQHH
ncbi:nicotinate-nucleotide--dimethylbenzimidazole phosphoribosyltransferase [Mitsuokella jalaludinii]|uniref:nicotinate-nucleotide--dimethylbenzimidazole phosphoribosyltransferase n=1 Tax=Mitsuokella jalaludinii TaxID=187979 RepID=UPI00242A8505|nr:nicotinate-nucleotide--dimethylbenzimidazole phosphoribosyltransferase [Mitsuokella jalaludinii]MCI6610865.1 nicotinate-nucleotide--dimethylbenzimidazole phosphoribosyltransferase [Mitsuokella jalaludinii]